MLSILKSEFVFVLRFNGGVFLLTFSPDFTLLPEAVDDVELPVYDDDDDASPSSELLDSRSWRSMLQLSMASVVKHFDLQVFVSVLVLSAYCRK